MEFNNNKIVSKNTTWNEKINNKTKEILLQLIAIDSSSNEVELAKWIENYIMDKFWNQLSFKHQLIWDKDRYNLIVENSKNPEILIAGHMDTVPLVNRKQLASQEIEDKIYGRWSVDMKAGLAINIRLLEELLKSNKEFMMLFYCDEEYYFKWMKKFIEEYKDKIQPKIVIITEPTDNKFILNFKWITEFELKIKWNSSHAAMWENWKSAILWINEFAKDLESFFKQSNFEQIFESTVNIAGIKWWLEQENKIIWKGNMIPDISESMIEVRIWSKVSQEEFEKFTLNWFKNNGYNIEKFQVNFYLSWLLQVWLDNKYSNIWVVNDGKKFWYSDIAMIQENLWWECLLYGPWPSSKAHQENEYVTWKSIIETSKKLKEILKL